MFLRGLKNSLEGDRRELAKLERKMEGVMDRMAGHETGRVMAAGEEQKKLVLFRKE